MSSAERKDSQKMLLAQRECHFCHKLGHLKRSCRKYLKKIKDKQKQNDKRKEELDKQWRKNADKSLFEITKVVLKLQEDLVLLKNGMKKKFVESNKALGDKVQSEFASIKVFTSELMYLTHQDLLNKFCQFHEDLTASDESSSSEEDLILHPSIIQVMKTEKSQVSSRVSKNSNRQKKSPSSKRKGKQNKRKS